MKDLFFRENILEILDYLDEGIHIIDSNGRVVYYNIFAQSIDGVDRKGYRPSPIRNISIFNP